jgi:hypothetical protein
VVLDVESFDYAYFVRGAKGFRVAIANALDQGPMLTISCCCLKKKILIRKTHNYFGDMYSGS